MRFRSGGHNVRGQWTTVIVAAPEMPPSIAVTFALPALIALMRPAFVPPSPAGAKAATPGSSLDQAACEVTYPMDVSE
jgi:hypothetical protein